MASSTKRPAKVKIVGKVYKVRVVTERAVGFDPGDYGDCDNDNLVIRIVAGRSLENDQDTLLHEIIHAVEFQMGLDGEINKKVSAEQRVQGTATGLLAVMKDNPALVRYLTTKA